MTIWDIKGQKLLGCGLNGNSQMRLFRLTNFLSLLIPLEIVSQEHDLYAKAHSLINENLLSADSECPGSEVSFVYTGGGGGYVT